MSQVFLSGARFGAKGSVAIGTADGMLLIVDGVDKSIRAWESEINGGNASGTSASGKRAAKISVAACWSNATGSIVLTGDSIGNVRILKANGDNLIQSSLLRVKYDLQGNPASIRYIRVENEGCSLHTKLITTYTWADLCVCLLTSRRLLLGPNTARL